MSLFGAYILPHPPIALSEIGKGKEKEIQKTVDSFKEIAKRISDLKPETIVVISPHSTVYSDYIHISPGKYAKGSFSDFGAGNTAMSLEYDTSLVDKIAEYSEKENIPAGKLGERGTRLDHGTMVPLYFVLQEYSDFKLVRISIAGLSGITHYRFGKVISKAIEDSGKRVLVIASGDLSHKLTEDGPYGFSDKGPLFDNEVTSCIKNADFLKLLMIDEEFCDSAAQCGLQSFNILSGILDSKSVQTELLSYEGPFGVGYAVASFNVTGEDNRRKFDIMAEKAMIEKCNNIRKNEDEYVRLARLSLEHFVQKGEILKRPENLSEELMNKKAGTFVSLKINGQLRGCIGTISAVKDCIADEIIRNAVSACSEDHRFDPVTKDELPFLVYSVDVLGETEPVNGIEELDANKYGVIVSRGMKRGLLLPNLEGVDTPKKQIEIALRKAGISVNEKYDIERFMVVRHK